MGAHVGIKELAGIAEIHLVNIVIDRFTGTASEVWDGKAIIRETGKPTATIEAAQFFHQVDFILTTGVADLFDRPKEHPLCTILGELRTEKDPHRWFRSRSDSFAHA